MSTSPARRMRRTVDRAVARGRRKRAQAVVKLDRYIREHPRDPLVVRLRALKAGLQVVNTEDMSQDLARSRSRENRTPSGLVLPPGVRSGER